VPHRLPFQIHVGTTPPDQWDDLEARIAAMAPDERLDRSGNYRFQTRPPLAAGDFPWEQLGVEPRFVGDETAECVAALNPSVFWNDGVDELERYLAGIERRGETALIVSTIGSSDPPSPRRVGQTHDDGIGLYQEDDRISGRRMPESVVPQVAPGATGADKDLALRLRDRSDGGPWWAIGLSPVISYRTREGEVVHPRGTIHPILVNDLGETLVGYWTAEGRPWRWYVVPVGSDWKQIIRWLTDRAIPELVPAALRRVRAPELVDDELLTPEELQARDELRSFEETTARQHAQLERDLDSARTNADAVRFDLLYGTGAPLVHAVSTVLRGAGFDVEDLDQTMGVGASGDLLAQYGGDRWLIEVKSATGRASEDLLEDLRRHIGTWPEQRPAESLTGGALIVNHQINLPPLERDRSVYTRSDFVGSLAHPVVPTVALFVWWRDHDRPAVVDAVTGPPQSVGIQLQPPAKQLRQTTSAASRPEPPEPPAGSPPRRRFGQRRGGRNARGKV
jgi:hypothetical protein